MTSWRNLIKEVEDEVIKPPSDPSMYRVIHLTNGLRICLISDPETDMAAAAMDVHVGYMSDPDDIPGLAHLCEHMCFLGTQKYCIENDFRRFITNHGGRSNASTCRSFTNYHFDVIPEYLADALDRFAQFFICPLFTESAIEKEVNVINSEYDGETRDDEIRIQYAELASMSPSHSFCKFGTGNRDTLLNIPKSRGQSIREELLKFHDKYYSSNMMALAVLGKESLDELEQMTVPLFGEIKNKDSKRSVCNDYPIREEDTKVEVHVVPICDIYCLKLIWPVEDYVSCPWAYLCLLLKEEGPGSLNYELRKKDWIESLSGDDIGPHGIGLYQVNVNLTKDGLEHTDEIITKIFQYINMLKRAGTQKWVWDEQTEVLNLHFSCLTVIDPMEYVKSISPDLHLISFYPNVTARNFMRCRYVDNEYQPELINNVIEILTPGNVRVTIVGKMFEGTADSEETWYGAQYTSQKISQSTLQQWNNAGFDEKFHLPAPNMFIPTDLQLLPLPECSSTHPVIIRENTFARLWYKQDDTFLQPMSCITVSIYNPSVIFDPDTFCGNMHILQDLLLDSLYQEESLLGAHLAGLSYEVVYYTRDRSITLYISGFNEKQKIFLDKIVHTLSTFSVKESQFRISKERYLCALNNPSEPVAAAEYNIDQLLSEEVDNSHRENFINMTAESFRCFTRQFVSAIYMEMLVCGNVSREQALELGDIAEGSLLNLMETKPVESYERTLMRTVKLPAGCKYLYQCHNEADDGSATLVYYECSNGTTHDNMLLRLFAQILDEPCYSILRTQEQLGYDVNSYVADHGIYIAIESDKHPQYVEERVDEFMEKMGCYIEDMSEDEFQDHINSVCSLVSLRDTCLELQHERYWNEIQLNKYHFDRNMVEAQHLRSLTKKDISEFYEQYISHKSPQHCKLSVYVLGNDQPAADMSKMVGVNEILDFNELKRAEEYHPLPPPCMDFVVSDCGTGTAQP